MVLEREVMEEIEKKKMGNHIKKLYTKKKKIEARLNDIYSRTLVEMIESFQHSEKSQEVIKVWYQTEFNEVKGGSCMRDGYHFYKVNIKYDCRNGFNGSITKGNVKPYEWSSAFNEHMYNLERATVISEEKDISIKPNSLVEILGAVPSRTEFLEELDESIGKLLSSENLSSNHVVATIHF